FLLRGAAQHHELGRRLLPRAARAAVRLLRRRLPGGLAHRAFHRRGRGRRLAQQAAAPQAPRPRRDRPRQDARLAPRDGGPPLRPEGGRRGRHLHQARARERRLRPRPARLLPELSRVSDQSPTGQPLHSPEAGSPQTRDELLKLLDRETAVARATDGRLAVLIIDLRRVDRLHALLKGPSPAMTMALVLERLRKALRPEDRIAPISDEQACVVLPRLAHQSQAVLAAVKLLRVLDRPIAHEGGSAVLRACVGIATLPEHGFDPAELLMAADISRQIAATREEGYHVFQGDEAVEAEVYRGLDLDLERAIRANELELHYQP